VTPAAVLFDFDGVLIDSRAAIANCINFGLEAVGAPTRTRAQLTPWIGPPLIHAFAELASPAAAQDALDAYRSRYVTSSLEETLPVPGALEALAEIAATAPTALATSKPLAFALPLCERLGFARHLTAIEGPSLEDVTETKAQTIARALTAVGFAPGTRAVMVGDRRHDVEGAHANDIRCVGVLWGIGDAAELEAAGADAVIGSPRDLPGSLYRLMNGG
jgi:phosphoglycolate phosphatase